VPKAKHPWANFLTARIAAIAWLTQEGRNDEEIINAMGMDQTQLIRLRLAHKIFRPILAIEEARAPSQATHTFVSKRVRQGWREHQQARRAKSGRSYARPQKPPMGP